MPEFARLPRWLRLIGRVARAGTYAAVAFIAVADVLVDQPGPDAVPDWLIQVISGLLFALAVWADIAVAAHRWRWEWVATFWVAAFLGIRSLLVWSDPGPPPPLAEAMCVTGLAIFFFLRGLDLTVFALRTSSWTIRLRAAAASGAV